MVGEVNKIIYNALVSGRGIYLPEVGTLYIERQAARRISSKKLLSPRNVVTFSSQERADSLVREIVRIALCSEEQAQDIYSRWLSKTRHDNHLQIEGVGELVDKSFRMEEGFSRLINPNGAKTLIIKSGSHWWIYAICLICVAISGGLLYYAYMGKPIISSVEAEQSQVSAVTVPVEEVVAVDTVAVDSVSVKSADVATEPDVTAESVAEEVATAFSHYVVYGVFSTEENAAKGVEQAKAKDGNVECSVIPYKNKYMVTIFGSNSSSECQRYVNRSPLPGLWIYSVK